VPAHPKLVAVDLGDGPQVRPVAPGGGALALNPRVTDTIKISVLDWNDIIDRTALGFDQLKPPGIAEVTALGRDGRPIAPADATRNRARGIDLECGRGPTIAIAGRFVHTSIHTTVGALLAGEPIAAQPCERDPITLAAGKQELLISPGDGFVVDGAALLTPPAGGLVSPPAGVVEVRAWGPDRREIRTDATPTARVLVVPESVSPGWQAHTADGARLTPVVVNGWQQGWVLPAGTGGTVMLTFPSNHLYRAGLFWGLALLPLLALLALVRPRREVVDEPARPWRPGPAVGAAAVLAVGWLIAGTVGALVFGSLLAVRYALSERQRLSDAITIGGTTTGFILAGAALSRHPWRSVGGYAGHSSGIQLLALVAIGALAVSVVQLSSGGSGLRRASQRLRATRHGDSTSA
jgi:arabinofuranan 3-O-arabinosyltransferase